jgi:hypothetical protein
VVNLIMFISKMVKKSLKITHFSLSEIKFVK